MQNALIRTRALLGDEGMEALRSARVAVFGIGGVGAACAEALARSGVGTVDLIDPDTVNESNLNRQLVALTGTVGMNKARAMAERIGQFGCDTRVNVHELFFDESTLGKMDLSEYDYIADCIDTVRSKMLIICEGERLHVPVISALGTGNKLHPEMLKLSDIHRTNVCPLARVIRRLCRERGIKHLNVVYSEEEAPHLSLGEENGRHPPASAAFVPNAAGMIMAGKIVRDLTGREPI